MAAAKKSTSKPRRQSPTPKEGVKRYSVADLDTFVAGGSPTEAGTAAGLTEADIVGGQISNEKRAEMLGETPQPGLALEAEMNRVDEDNRKAAEEAAKNT